MHTWKVILAVAQNGATVTQTVQADQVEVEPANLERPLARLYRSGELVATYSSFIGIRRDDAELIELANGRQLGGGA